MWVNPKLSYLQIRFRRRGFLDSDSTKFFRCWLVHLGFVHNIFTYILNIIWNKILFNLKWFTYYSKTVKDSDKRLNFFNFTQAIYQISSRFLIFLKKDKNRVKLAWCFLEFHENTWSILEIRELRGVNEEKILNFQSLRGEKGVILLFQVFSMYFHEIPKKHHASLSRFLIFIWKFR